jgi:hypothetical protein
MAGHWEPQCGLQIWGAENLSKKKEGDLERWDKFSNRTECTKKRGPSVHHLV